MKKLSIYLLPATLSLGVIPSPLPVPSASPSPLPVVSPSPMVAASPSPRPTRPVRVTPVQVKKTPIENCSGGVLTEATFDFSNPDYAKEFEVVVFPDGYKTLDEAVASLREKGYTVVAVTNGGYFDDTHDAHVYSFFKSSYFGLENPENSLRSPRACMVYHSVRNTFDVAQSTASNYLSFKKTKDTEIFCAGPQLVEAGENVAMRQYCAESFDEACRPDHSDSGIDFLASIPRTASCVTASGKYKIFTAVSSLPDCGLEGEKLAEYMIAEGCSYGINHDGGGSTNLFVDDARGNQIRQNGVGVDSNRKIPVWIAVVKRKELLK